MELTVCFLALGFIGTGTTAKKVFPPCDQRMFYSDVDNCLSVFNHSMETSGYEDRCTWPTVKGFYYQLQTCVNETAVFSRCRGYGSLLDDVYLAVHRKYFSLCGMVRDPPLITLILLIAPSIIITLLMPFVCLPLVTRGHKKSLIRGLMSSHHHRP